MTESTFFHITFDHMFNMVYGQDMTNTVLIDETKPEFTDDDKQTLAKIICVKFPSYESLIQPIINKEFGSVYIKSPDLSPNGNAQFAVAAHMPLIVQTYEPEPLAEVFPIIFPYIDDENFAIGVNKLTNSENNLLLAVLENSYDETIPNFINRLELDLFEQLEPGIFRNLSDISKALINEDRMKEISNRYREKGFFNTDTEFSVKFSDLPEGSSVNAWGNIAPPGALDDAIILPSSDDNIADIIIDMCVSCVNDDDDKKHFMYDSLVILENSRTAPDE